MSIVLNEKMVEPHRDARNKIKEGATSTTPLVSPHFPVKHLLSRCGEIRLSHPHSTFPKSEKTSFRTYSLYVGPRQIILRHDELLQVDVLAQAHSRCVQSENVTLGFDVWQWELDFTIDTPWTDERRIERGVDAVGGHDDLHFATCVESVDSELVQEFQHRPLDFMSGLLMLSRTWCICESTVAAMGSYLESAPFGSNGVNFINEDDTWCMFFCHPDQLSDNFGTVTKVFLDELLRPAISIFLTDYVLVHSFAAYSLYSRTSPRPHSIAMLIQNTADYYFSLSMAIRTASHSLAL